MATIEKYAHYTAIQLATDVHFITWVKFRNEANEQFWKEYLNKYPSQQAVVNRARGIVNEMQIVRESMEDENAEEVWNRINNEVKRSTSKVARTSVVSMRRWWAAAAIFLVVATGGYLLLTKEKTPLTAQTDGNQQPLKNDVLPGSNKAMLILADGTQMALDTISKGTIAEQGNVSIINHDGILAYSGLTNEVPSSITYNTITIPKGGQYQVELADGSKVWLNSASSLRFPTSFTGSERKVELTGEAYFEIAKNSAMPFIVQKGEASVHVLGTHFNINAYDDEDDIKVTLLEGAVNVSKGNATIQLKPGQQARVTDEIQILNNVNIEKVMAWKNGWFEFDNTELPAIMRQVSRWYDVEVVYEGKLTSQTFGGRISKNLPMSEIMQMLESNGVDGYRIEGKKLIVKP